MIRLCVVNIAGGFLLAWASWLGFVRFAYAGDTTPISLTIAGLFVFGLLITARLALSPGSSERTELLNDIAKWCASLGMFGTIVGLVMMAFSLQATDISNANQLAKAITAAFQGYGVALLTTAVGLVFGAWTEINFRIVKMMRAAA